MQEINEENLDELVEQAQDPELLKELIPYAVQWGREDLVEKIIDKTILQNRLVEKLHDFAVPPITFSFFGDSDSADDPGSAADSPSDLAP